MVDDKFVIDNYGHVLPFGEITSCYDWSKIIEATYDMSNPRNKAVYNYVRFRGSNMYAHRTTNDTIYIFES